MTELPPHDRVCHAFDQFHVARSTSPNAHIAVEANYDVAIEPVSSPNRSRAESFGWGSGREQAASASS